MILKYKLNFEIKDFAFVLCVCVCIIMWNGHIKIWITRTAPEVLNKLWEKYWRHFTNNREKKTNNFRYFRFVHFFSLVSAFLFVLKCVHMILLSHYFNEIKDDFDFFFCSFLFHTKKCRCFIFREMKRKTECRVHINNAWWCVCFVKIYDSFLTIFFLYIFILFILCAMP